MVRHHYAVKAQAEVYTLGALEFLMQGNIGRIVLLATECSHPNNSFRTLSARLKKLYNIIQALTHGAVVAMVDFQTAFMCRLCTGVQLRRLFYKTATGPDVRHCMLGSLWTRRKFRSVPHIPSPRERPELLPSLVIPTKIIEPAEEDEIAANLVSARVPPPDPSPWPAAQY